jgi:hypothetical protein
MIRLFGFSPEGGTRTAGVRKPPNLDAHPTRLNARRATYGEVVSGEWYAAVPSRLSPQASGLLRGV